VQPRISPIESPATSLNASPLSELRAQVCAGPPYAPSFLALLQDDPRAGARQLYERCVRRSDRAAREEERAREMMRFEEEARANGFTAVAGVDEAGRGPLAGPIAAAAVVLAEPVPGLNDSKQLTAEERDELFEILHQGAHRIGVAVIPPERIDADGLQNANYAAMAEAAGSIDPPPDFLLVDGFQIPGCPIPQKRIVKGDCRSQSIAAASVIAKVTRDRIMYKLDQECPGYGFARHKGYATQEHLDALARLGPSPAHRRSFAPIAEQCEQMDLDIESSAGGPA